MQHSNRHADEPLHVDALSSILALMSLQGSLSPPIDALGAWSLRCGTQSLLQLLYVSEGTVWISTEADEFPTKVQAGDFVLIIGKKSYCVASDPELLPADEGPACQPADHETTTRIGRAGKRAMLIQGSFAFDPDAAELLLPLMPAVVHVSATSQNTTRLSLLGHSMRLATESVAPGNAICRTSLAVIAFVEIVRIQIASGPRPAGWLAGYADPKISIALDLIHAGAHGWKVEELAEQVEMSRSAFATRFKDFIGVSPAEYVTSWRMALARLELKHGGQSSAAATNAGYSNVAAFGTAFKRETGFTPRQYRLQRGKSQIK